MATGLIRTVSFHISSLLITGWHLVVAALGSSSSRNVQCSPPNATATYFDPIRSVDIASLYNRPHRSPHPRYQTISSKNGCETSWEIHQERRGGTICNGSRLRTGWECTCKRGRSTSFTSEFECHRLEIRIWTFGWTARAPPSIHLCYPFLSLFICIWIRIYSNITSGLGIDVAAEVDQNSRTARRASRIARRGGKARRCRSGVGRAEHEKAGRTREERGWSVG
jgi:hypothetical protein